MKPICILLCFLLSACGFHLRGFIYAHPWLNCVSVIVKQSDKNLCQNLIEYLEANNIRVSPPGSSPYHLIIESDDLQKNIMSISSSTAARQYELIYTVYFKLIAVNKKELISLHPITVTRILTVNSNRILGSNDEEAILKSEMQREAAMLILYQVTKEGSHETL